MSLRTFTPTDRALPRYRTRIKGKVERKQEKGCMLRHRRYLGLLKRDVDQEARLFIRAQDVQQFGGTAPDHSRVRDSIKCVLLV